MKHMMKHARGCDPASVALSTIVLCIATATSALAAPPGHLWSYGFGSTGDDDGLAVAVDNAGNIVAAGDFWGTVNFGGGDLTSAGGPDVFIAKYDAYGVHQWSHRFGGTVYDYAYGIAVDGSGNVYVIGYFQGMANFGGSNLTSAGGADIFVAKYNANGVHQWSQRFGDASDQLGLGITVDTAGNVFVTGIFRGTVDFGGGGLTSVAYWDIFLVKFNTNGVHQWSKRFGGTGNDYGESVAVDATGNVYLAGAFQGTASFGGNDLVGAGYYDVVLAKYSAAGVHQWSRCFGGTGDDEAYSVVADGSGNVLMTGQFDGTANFGGANLVSAGGLDHFVAKYDAGGAHQWSHGFGGTGWDMARSIAVDESGNALITGWFEGTANFGGANLVSAGSQDIVVAKYDASGVHQWSQSFGGAGADRGYSVAADRSGNVVTTGYFQATIDFGGGSLLSAGGRDIYVAKFGHNPNEPSITSISDVGNDQGRKVKIRFNGSSLDAVASPTPVIRYVAFRRDNPTPPAIISRGTAALTDRELLDAGWTQVGSVSAFTKASYGIDVPTLGDSTVAHGQYYSAFFIRAATATPATFFDSPPDSGYSLDNLSPGVPGGFVYSAGMLSWSQSNANDFDHYTVYGSSTRCFCTATLIDQCAVPTLDVSDSPYDYYFVTATDASGNEGKPAMVNALAGVGGTPKGYVLSISAYPNPFNPSTAIRYTVPSKGWVTVAIYDARGARVATLLDAEKPAGAFTEAWSGRDDDGRAVASGVYFARVSHDSNTKSYKLVLIK